MAYGKNFMVHLVLEEGHTWASMEPAADPHRQTSNPPQGGKLKLSAPAAIP